MRFTDMPSEIVTNIAQCFGDAIPVTAAAKLSETSSYLNSVLSSPCNDGLWLRYCRVLDPHRQLALDSVKGTYRSLTEELFCSSCCMCGTGSQYVWAEEGIRICSECFSEHDNRRGSRLVSIINQHFYEKQPSLFVSLKPRSTRAGQRTVFATLCEAIQAAEPGQCIQVEIDVPASNVPWDPNSFPPTHIDKPIRIVGAKRNAGVRFGPRRNENAAPLGCLTKGEGRGPPPDPFCLPD